MCGHIRQLSSAGCVCVDTSDSSLVLAVYRCVCMCIDGVIRLCTFPPPCSPSSPLYPAFCLPSPPSSDPPVEEEAQVCAWCPVCPLLWCGDSQCGRAYLTTAQRSHGEGEGVHSLSIPTHHPTRPLSVHPHPPPYTPPLCPSPPTTLHAPSLSIPTHHPTRPLSVHPHPPPYTPPLCSSPPTTLHAPSLSIPTHHPTRPLSVHPHPPPYTPPLCSSPPTTLHAPSLSIPTHHPTRPLSVHPHPPPYTPPLCPSPPTTLHAPSLCRPQSEGSSQECGLRRVAPPTTFMARTGTPQCLCQQLLRRKGPSLQDLHWKWRQP